MTPSTKTRRTFLGQGVGLIGAGAVGALAPEAARGFLANDAITVGCIGTGGRCQALMKSLANVPGVRIAAVCDVYEPNREGARKLADKDAAAFLEVMRRQLYRGTLKRQEGKAVRHVVVAQSQTRLFGEVIGHFEVDVMRRDEGFPSPTLL